MAEKGKQKVGYTCSECEITQREIHVPLAGILLLAKWDIPIGTMSRATDYQARIVTDILRNKEHPLPVRTKAR